MPAAAQQTIDKLKADIELAKTSYNAAVDHLNAKDAAEAAAYEVYCNCRQAYINVNSVPDASPTPDNLVQWAVDRAADDLHRLSKELEVLRSG